MVNTSQEDFKEQPAFMKKYNDQKEKLFKNLLENENLSENIRNKLTENN